MWKFLFFGTDKTPILIQFLINLKFLAMLGISLAAYLCKHLAAHLCLYHETPLN